MLRFLLPALLFCSLHSMAQGHKNYWYSGSQGTGIRFVDGEPVFDSKSQIGSNIGAVSMSDSSGNLLFYSNGGAFYNKNHEAMEGSKGGVSAYSRDVITLPSQSTTGIYWVYTINMGWIDMYSVDMNANDGLGKVLLFGRQFPFDGQYAETVTAVKSCENNSYWLITARNVASRAQILCMKIDPVSGRLSRHSTLLLEDEISYMPWEMVASTDGESIAMVSDQEAYLIQFDPTCGIINSAEKLALPETGGKPKGAFFSPNGDYLYLTQSKVPGAKEGYIYQIDYKLPESPERYKNFKQTNYALHHMLTGPDGRLYIATDNDAGGVRNIDRIANPNNIWSDIQYETSVVTYPLSTILIPHFPNFVNDTRDCSTLNGPKLLSGDFCEGDSVKLEFKNTAGSDSIFLIDLDFGTPYLINTTTSLKLAPKPSGKYNYQLSWRSCGQYQRSKEVHIIVGEYPILQVSDTTICTGDTLELKRPEPDFNYEFFFKQDGNWRPQLANLFSEGEYKTAVSNKICTSEDSFKLTITPPLLTSLAGAYRFCEEEGIPITLDAGKGFEGYLWYPTQDSTQWISVRQKGQYYVVVNDSRGCKGRGDTEVRSDCSPQVFVPNAFSPNGDGRNDSFVIGGKFILAKNLRIYDRWGALVHYGPHPKTAWNGTKKGALLPTGMYFYRFTYEDAFTGKRYNISGPLYLLR